MYSDPRTLFLSFSDIIRKIVYLKLISKGWFRHEEARDLEQEVMKRLLEKTGIIQAQYAGESKLSTYLISIINNICFELCRNSKKEPQTSSTRVNEIINLPDNQINMNSTPDYDLRMEEAISLLDAIFKVYPLSKYKLILFLKILYALPVYDRDIRLYCNSADVDKLKVIIGEHNNANITKSGQYDKLQMLVNLCENKIITGDAVRKWLDKRIQQILSLLKKMLETEVLDESSLRILFEKYCIKMSKLDQ